jgi:hypothetical protein
MKATTERNVMVYRRLFFFCSTIATFEKKMKVSFANDLITRRIMTMACT